MFGNNTVKDLIFAEASFASFRFSGYFASFNFCKLNSKFRHFRQQMFKQGFELGRLLSSESTQK